MKENQVLNVNSDNPGNSVINRSFTWRNLLLGCFYFFYLFCYRLLTDTFVYRQAWQFIKDGNQNNETKLSADPEFIIPIVISVFLSSIAGFRECMVMHRNLQLREANNHQHSRAEVLLIAAPSAAFAIGGSLSWQRIINNTFDFSSLNIIAMLAISLPQVILGAVGAYLFHVRAYEVTRQDAGFSGFWSHYDPRQVKPSRLLYYTWTILSSHFLNGCIAVYLLISQLSVSDENKSGAHDVSWWLGTAAAMLALAFPHALVEGNTEALSILVVKREGRDNSHHCLSSFTNVIDTIAGVNHSMTKAIALPLLLAPLINQLFVNSSNSTDPQTSVAAIFFRAVFFLLQGLVVVVANTEGFRYAIKYSLTHLEPEEERLLNHGSGGNQFRLNNAINSMEIPDVVESNPTKCCWFSK